MKSLQALDPFKYDFNCLLLLFLAFKFFVIVILRRYILQNIERIPDDLKALYKTVWEIPQKVILEMAADRGAFIDQSQSLNVHIGDPTTEKLTSMHFFGWKSVSDILQCINVVLMY